MEREVIIRHAGEYFGNLSFFYENYHYGRVLVQRKELRETIVDKFTQKELIQLYSKFEPFSHEKITLEQIEYIDRTFVYSFFDHEIKEKEIDIRDFQIYYLNNLAFEKLLWNQDIGFVGKIVISINSADKTKTFSFESFIKELVQFNCRIKERFDKINKHIVFEFLNKKINPIFPNTYSVN